MAMLTSRLAYNDKSLLLKLYKAEAMQSYEIYTVWGL